MSSHERSFSSRHADDERARSPDAGPALVPGKRTLTEDLPAGGPVQRKPGAASRSSAAGAGGGDWMTAAFGPGLLGGPSAVQRRAGADAGSDPAQVHAAAQRGISGGAQALPHLDLIQRSFGRHDVSGVKAHLGAEAAEGAGAMGATAFATGDHVAFAGTPDLHTAAHEAAHVVQQRAGVHLKGGVGEEGDEHERHADAVADRVVAGQSAEGLLDRYAGPGGAPAAGAAVQGKAVQRAVKARKLGSQDFKSLGTLAGLFELFEIDDTGKQAYAQQMKARMFAGNTFSQTYKAQFDESPAIQKEVLDLAAAVDDLIAGAGSQNVVSVTQGKGDELANQLFAIIGGGITAQYALGKCPHYAMAQGLGGQSGTDYLAFLKATQVKLREYAQAIDHEKYDGKTLETNAKMENRIQDLGERATALEGELRTAVAQQRPTGPIVAKLNQFRQDLAIIEQAIDLDREVGKRSIQDKLTALTTDETEHNSYRPDGGTDDGVSVRDQYENNKACSLFALLAVVPGFMGAQTPEQLHHILRKTRTLKNYDDDPVVAQIRFAAGLKPTMQAGRQLGDFIQKELDEKDKQQAFIADPIGQAHTFAVVNNNGVWQPRDNESDSRTNIMQSNAWKQKRIGTTWML